MARIAYESDTTDDYLKNLKTHTILCLKTLDVIRDIIKGNIRKGLLPNYTNKLMNLDSQYNTIGIIGLYCCLQKFNFVEKDGFGYTKYTDNGVEFAKQILSTINEVKDEFKKENGCEYSINIEQIPGERAAAILMEKDKMFYPNEKYELPLYGNQWIPLGVKTSIQEKVRLSAILDKACNGG